MSLKVKFLFACGLMLVTSLGLIAYGIYGSGTITDRTVEVEQTTYPALDRAIRLSDLIRESKELLLRSIDEVDEYLLEEMQVLANEFGSIIDDLANRTGDQDLYAMNLSYEEYVNKGSEIANTYIQSQNIEDIIEHLPFISEQATLLNQLIHNYRDEKTNSFNNALTDIRNQSENFKTLFAVAGALLFLVILGLTALLFNVIGSIQGLVAVAAKLSQGNLTEPIIATRVDEIGTLQRTFEKMRSSLRDMIDHLDLKVEERTLELSAAKKEMSDILNSIEQGIFTFNLDKTVNVEHSARAKILFHTDSFEQSSLGQLLSMSTEQEMVFDKWMQVISKSPMTETKWNRLSKLNPVVQIEKMVKDEKLIVQIQYKPIRVGENVNKIMVLAADVTRQLAAEKALEVSKREQQVMMGRVIGIVSSEIHEIQDFINDTLDTLDTLNTFSDSNELINRVNQLFRELHTLKGHSGTFGFDELALRLTTAEAAMDELRKGNDIDMEHWKSCLHGIAEELDHIVLMKNKIFQGETEDKLSINKEAYLEILGNLKNQPAASLKGIYASLCDLNSQSFDSYCQKYRNLISRFSSKSNKYLAKLVVDTPDVLVHRDVMKEIDKAVVHIIRNAVDHGIESNEQRQELQKGPGTLTVSFEVRDEQQTMVIRDDGGGIDGNKIAVRAMEKGMLSADQYHKLSEKEKVELIFTPGLTTNDAVTDTSGRGVGMDAVAEVMKDINGTVDLHTELGKGTSIVLTFPTTSALLYKDLEPMDLQANHIIPS